MQPTYRMRLALCIEPKVPHRGLQRRGLPLRRGVRRRAAAPVAAPLPAVHAPPGDAAARGEAPAPRGKAAAGPVPQGVNQRTRGGVQAGVLLWGARPGLFGKVHLKRVPGSSWCQGRIAGDRGTSRGFGKRVSGCVRALGQWPLKDYRWSSLTSLQQSAACRCGPLLALRPHW